MKGVKGFANAVVNRSVQTECGEGLEGHGDLQEGCMEWGLVNGGGVDGVV